LPELTDDEGGGKFSLPEKVPLSKNKYEAWISNEF
jgi:hypothetical protein